MSTRRATMEVDGRVPASQRALAAIEHAIHEVIGRPIGESENFFDAGLTSRALVEVHLAGTRELADPFPVTALFAYPNLRALRRHLLEAGLTGRPRDRESASRGGTDSALSSDRLHRIRQARRELRRRSRSEAGEHD